MSGALDMGRGHDAITFDAGGKDLVGNTNDMPQERISFVASHERRAVRDGDEGRVAGGCLTVLSWLTGTWECRGSVGTQVQIGSRARRKASTWPFWLSKVFVQSARSTSTRTRIGDRPALRATLFAKPLAVPHQGPLNASTQPVAMRCVDPVGGSRVTPDGCGRLWRDVD
jgi:hypothetical protein